MNSRDLLRLGEAEDGAEEERPGHGSLHNHRSPTETHFNFRTLSKTGEPRVAPPLLLFA